MSENHLIRNIADFTFFDKNKRADIVKVKNSENLETEFYIYSKNFHFAADQISDSLLTFAAENRDIAKLDTWFFAILYLYRQSLELILKAIVFSYVTNAHDRIELLKDVKHDLMKCFRIITDNLDVSENYKMIVNLNWLGQYLSDISLIDKQSDMFRYPFNHKMEKFFKEKTSVDLVHVKQNLNTAYYVLCDLFKKDYSGNTYELPSPQFLIYGGDYYRQSVIGYKFSHRDFYPFVKSYQESANLLKNIMINDTNRTVLFLPMCYLYRNAIELGLKRILVDDCNFHFLDALSIINKKKHSVLGLWREIKQEIENHSDAPDGDTTLADVESYIVQLHNFDSDSSKFRYPINMNLQFHFIKEKEYSIENISNCFNELIIFLDGVDCMLGQIREWEAEMRRNYRRTTSNESSQVILD